MIFCFTGGPKLLVILMLEKSIQSHRSIEKDGISALLPPLYPPLLASQTPTAHSDRLLLENDGESAECRISHVSLCYRLRACIFHTLYRHRTLYRDLNSGYIRNGLLPGLDSSCSRKTSQTVSLTRLPLGHRRDRSTDIHWCWVRNQFRL